MSVNVTEPKTARSLPHTAPNPLFLRDQELTRGVELLDFAYRALTAEPDRILDGLGLGRNHRRVIHIDRAPAGDHPCRSRRHRPADQAEPVPNHQGAGDQGSDRARASQTDRRRRPLRLTEQGTELEERLNSGLRRRLALAYRAAGADAVAGYHQVLLGLVDERARRHIMAPAELPTAA